jgi:hypothetical protein
MCPPHALGEFHKGKTMYKTVGIAMFLLLLSHNMNAQTPISGASATGQRSNSVEAES